MCASAAPSVSPACLRTSGFCPRTISYLFPYHTIPYPENRPAGRQGICAETPPAPRARPHTLQHAATHDLAPCCDATNPAVTACPAKHRTPTFSITGNNCAQAACDMRRCSRQLPWRSPRHPSARRWLCVRATGAPQHALCECVHMRPRPKRPKHLSWYQSAALCSCFWLRGV